MQDSTINIDFSIELFLAGPLSNSIQQAWRALLISSKSHEKVFQTPGYFEFVSQIPNKGNSQELVVAKNTQNQEIIAILPLRAGRRSLNLNIGNYTLVYLRLRTIALLGSMPLAEYNPQLLDTVIDFIFKSFPEQNTIAMQSLPQDSDFYLHLKKSTSIQKKYGIFVKDGWRVCHTTPLPDSFSTYLSHLKAKKRYNLNRQLKLLEKEAGPIQLVRIETPEQIPELVAAIEQLAPKHVLKNFLNQKQFTSLAHKKIILSYILKCDATAYAIIIGMKAEGTYHIHNIIYAPDKSYYSLGTSILHLATEDIINNLKISLIDYGYGNPEHPYHSSNVSILRGHVFLYQKTWANRLMFFTYSAYSTLVDTAKALIYPSHSLPRVPQSPPLSQPSSDLRFCSVE